MFNPIILSLLTVVWLFTIAILAMKYSKVYYLFVCLSLVALVYFFAFSEKVGKKLYGIEVGAEVEYSPQRKYNDWENTLPYRRYVGVTTLSLVFVVFVLSVLNVVEFGKKYRISHVISGLMGVVTLVILLISLFFIMMYMHPIV